MRRGRQEQPVFEAFGEVFHRPGDLCVDGILRSARRCGVVRFIQNEQRARSEVVQPRAEWTGVFFPDEKFVRDEKT